jgi:phenylpropionate dioxygenase-like ring-hydroxylating dioxygenase large terminal subunit
MKRRKIDIGGLFDAENGVVSPELFVNSNIFDQEMENVFTRGWLLVGHESLIPKPNDYFISRMGQESVILTRNKQG